MFVVMIEYKKEEDTMYDYITGKIASVEYDHVVIENNGIGYIIYVPNPYSYQENKEYKIFTYQQIKEDDNSLFGFQNKDEKNLFLKLIGVKGLGCKMALPILAAATPEGIMDAIERENVLYLKKFPKIGDKLAKQMILDLKGKLGVIANNIEEDNKDELIEVLKGLGYKEKEIKTVVSKVDSTLPIESQVKESLKLLLK